MNIMKIYNTIINHKNIIINLMFIISILCVLIYIRPTTIQFDENYTMGLISHNYFQILQLDKLDVHPPLYYLTLKFFLNISTFWTSYLPIKIIFGRLFTIMSSIVSLMFLCKTTKILRIKNNYIISWLVFLILPTVLGFSFSYQQMTNLRMYALAGMFISIEFYYLLKFRLNSKNIYLIIALITASLASYTHYYSAIFAGLLLLLYFFKYILDHNMNKSIKMMMSGILFGILYLPWIESLIKQMNMSQTYWISYYFMIKQILLCIFCIFIFIFPIIKYYKISKNILFKEQILLILNILIFTLLFSTIFGIVNHPIFIIRYMYPMLLIYEFIGINVMIKLIINKLFIRHQLYYYIFIMIILILNSGISLMYQIPNYIIPSINAVNNYNNWNKNKNKNVYITNREIFGNGNNPDFNFSNLLYSKNKSRLYVPYNFITSDYIQKNPALKKVFYNNTKNINYNK